MTLPLCARHCQFGILTVQSIFDIRTIHDKKARILANCLVKTNGLERDKNRLCSATLSLRLRCPQWSNDKLYTNHEMFFVRPAAFGRRLGNATSTPWLGNRSSSRFLEHFPVFYCQGSHVQAIMRYRVTRGSSEKLRK